MAEREPYETPHAPVRPTAKAASKRAISGCDDWRSRHREYRTGMDCPERRDSSDRVAALRLLRVSFTDQVISIATLLAWSFLMFSYLHDRMHIKNFWMGRIPCSPSWFLRARRLHDIHHHVLNNEGLMDRNFGIGFFAFDRLFGTLASQPARFNRLGYAIRPAEIPESPWRLATR